MSDEAEQTAANVRWECAEMLIACANVHQAEGKRLEGHALSTSAATEYRIALTLRRVADRILLVGDTK